MPECKGCGSVVSKDYVRVFTPEDLDQPRACPRCPDRVRSGAEVREARATRG